VEKVTAMVWMPLAMSPPKGVCRAASASMWNGCRSKRWANSTMAASVSVSPGVRKIRPGVRSSK
jgi:hypothetical protein